MVEALHHRFEGVLLGQEGVLIRPDELALGLDCRIAHRAASAWECVEQLIQRLLHRLSIALPLQGKAGDQRLGGLVRPPAAELYGVFLGDYNIIRLGGAPHEPRDVGPVIDRKSTRLNSSHEWISYAVFCLKKKKTTKKM